MGYKASSFITTPSRHPFLICHTVKYLWVADIAPCPATASTSSKSHNSVNKLIKFQENILNCFQITERKIYYRNHYDILDIQRAMTPKVGSPVEVYERKEGQLSVSAEMINS